MTRLLALVLLLCAARARAWRASSVPSRSMAISRHAEARRHLVAATPAPGTSPRTLSDVEHAFFERYAKPLYPPYSTMVDEILSSLALTLCDSRFEYSKLFALGLSTLMRQALVIPPTLIAGAPVREPNIELAEAVCEALELKRAQIEEDAKSVRNWASGMTESQILEVMRASDAEVDAASTADAEAADASAPEPAADAPAPAAATPGPRPLGRLRSLFGGGHGGEIARELRGLAQAKYPFYHRCIGLGLFALMEQCDASPRLAAVSRWATALGVKESKLRKDYEWQFDALERILETEERRLEEDVRKLQKRADALLHEAEAARRAADEAEGIAPPPPPAAPPQPTPETAEQAAAAAELGQALADVEGLGEPGADKPGSGAQD